MCLLSFLFPFARFFLFCFAVGLSAKKLKHSFARLRCLRPDTFSLSAAVTLLTGGMLLIGQGTGHPATQTATAVLFLFALSGEPFCRDTEGIFIAISFFLASCGFFLSVCLTGTLTGGAEGFIGVLLVCAAWEQKESSCLCRSFLFTR